jgi:hypothetical protein
VTRTHLHPVLAAALALAACEGGSGSPSGGAPTPTPTVTPNPSPTPAPTPTPSNPFLANIAGPPGVTLDVDAACTSAPPRYSGTVLNNPGLGTVTLGSYGTLVAAAGSPTPRLTIAPYGANALEFYRSEVSASPYASDFFSLSDHTIQLLTTRFLATPNATVGLTDYGRLCFFAAGPPPAARPATIVTFRGSADGLIQSGNLARRLFPGHVDGTVNLAAGTGSIRLQLNTYYEVPIGDDFPVTIGSATANLKLAGNEVEPAALSAPPEWTGTISGQLVGTSGMILVFRVQNPAGQQIWGAAALDSGAF